jgi:hypothetical protein
MLTMNIRQPKFRDARRRVVINYWLYMPRNINGFSV